MRRVDPGRTRCACAAHVCTTVWPILLAVLLIISTTIPTVSTLLDRFIHGCVLGREAAGGEEEPRSRHVSYSSA